MEAPTCRWRRVWFRKLLLCSPRRMHVQTMAEGRAAVSEAGKKRGAVRGTKNKMRSRKWGRGLSKGGDNLECIKSLGQKKH